MNLCQLGKVRKILNLTNSLLIKGKERFIVIKKENTGI